MSRKIKKEELETEYVLKNADVLNIIEKQVNYITFLENKVAELEEIANAQNLQIEELLEDNYRPF